MTDSVQDAEVRARIRVFREPATLIVVSLILLANVIPRNLVFGVRTKETMASDASWVAGNRAGGLALLAAGVVWALAGVYLPRRYVKLAGIAAVLASAGILFIVQGWTFF
jgi:uncharacterized membrane protein